MAKHRKSLKEKKQADIRRGSLLKTVPLAKIGPKINFNQTSISPQLTAVVSATNKYPYLIQDVLKVGIVTTTIIAVQIILFFLLKKQIFVLPMVKY